MTKTLFISPFVAVFILLSSTIVSAGSLVGKVVKVADGDTITVVDNQNIRHKIRLVGIDAPENRQPYGQASKKSLSDLVFGKQVTVDFNKLDRYKRVIGKVFQNGEDVNLAQVKRGMAWHYKKYQNEQELDDRSLYANEEYLAQRDRRGLWSDKEPVSPWDFRKPKK